MNFPDHDPDFYDRIRDDFSDVTDWKKVPLENRNYKYLEELKNTNTDHKEFRPKKTYNKTK